MLAISGLEELTASQRKVTVQVGSNMEAFTGMITIVVIGTNGGVLCLTVAMVETRKSITVVVMTVVITVLWRYLRRIHLSSIVMGVAVSV